MKKILVAGIAAAAFCGAPALAADMVVKAPPQPAVAPPGPTWAGWYVGVNGGYGWDANAQNQNILITTTPALGGYPATTPGSLDPKGGFGGVTLGYNWQLANIVFGVEG